jgi:serine/threonine protein kinase
LPPLHLHDLYCSALSNFVTIALTSQNAFHCIAPAVDVEGFRMIGKTLGHYQITSQIGKGGMGEVFQAKDHKLGRDVAIKVLPEEFAKDADRVARFQREAKLLASMNHSNIAAIYGLEESSATSFLVLELVEGQTLADRIKTGPIPVEESLKLALQIAEALEAAHEKGVIHRDLKPSNIKVTPDGKVKVLDFGLAKAYAGDREEVNLSNSPTLSDAATQQGMILGTAAYMSPEQARGKAVDKRADIWAFGCVLFEMLTGRASFSGRDVTEILAAVIRAEPEWDKLPANLHWRLKEVLERCLKKELRDRYHDISDVRMDLERVLNDPTSVSEQTHPSEAHRRRSRTTFLWLGAIILTAIIVGLAIWNFRPAPKPESHQTTRFSYELPKDYSGGFAVSPDGRQFVYATPSGFYLRSLDELEARPIPGTQGNPQWPFFSPDGKWIGYWSPADSKLKKIAVTGGTPTDLCEIKTFSGAMWNTDDSILYVEPAGKGIVRIFANGGIPEVLVKSNGIYSYPQLLPDGKSVLFTDATTQPRKIRVHSLTSGEQKEILDAVWAQYLAIGYLAYVTGNGPYNIYAVPFDLEKLEAKGRPFPILNGISNFAFSDSGTLVYSPWTSEARLTTQHMPVWVDENGKEEFITGAPTNFTSPFNISPDGKRVVFTEASTTAVTSVIWIWDLARESMTRLTFGDNSGEFPIWAPDGRRIVYMSRLKGQNCAIYMKTADGTGEVEALGSFPLMPAPHAWSKDGKTLVLGELTYSFQADIAVLSLEGNRERRILLQDNFVQTHPRTSPDGRWLAYVSLESGKPEIYVRPFPEVKAGKWQVSTGGGVGPLWSPDSRKIYYRNGDAVMAVDVETAPAFKLDKPKVLFQRSYYYMRLGDAVQPVWDIRPDGKRFMMIKPVQPMEKGAAPQAPLKLNVVLNWTEELKQRVPVK